jgi:hypothetical protein
MHYRFTRLRGVIFVSGLYLDGLNTIARNRERDKGDLFRKLK